VWIRRPSSAGSLENSATCPPENTVAALDRTALSFGASALHLGPLSNAARPRDYCPEEPCPSVNQPVDQAMRRVEMAVGPGSKVFVVEDDDGMREAIETLLDAAGIESAAYASAEALLAADGIDRAKCVISDLKLPAMSGLELLATLRARGMPPPFILVTAHDSPGVRSEAERLGVAAYLPKPFSGSELLAAVESVSAEAK
jgi:CheY-like chemotaxis protein